MTESPQVHCTCGRVRSHQGPRRPGCCLPITSGAVVPALGHLVVRLAFRLCEMSHIIRSPHAPPSLWSTPPAMTEEATAADTCRSLATSGDLGTGHCMGVATTTWLLGRRSNPSLVPCLSSQPLLWGTEGGMPGQSNRM